MPPSITIPISQLPAGTVPTIAALRLINTSTMTDGAYVTVLGSGAFNDGFQTSYFWSGACVQTDNSITVITGAPTGAWIRSIDTPTLTTSQTVSYSGIGENFVILSGISGASNTVVYTLPPYYVMGQQQITIKSLSTGTNIIKPAGTDLIFPTNSTVATTGITFTNSGASYHFQPYNGVYYQV